MPEAIKFTVITATYNHAYVLWRAILSVQKQIYPYWEHIVVDDASTDDTAKLIKQFKDPRLRYYCLSKNSGPSAARNFGLKHARGDYVAYLDSDNVWYDDFLLVMAEATSQYKDKILFFCKKNYRLSLIDAEGKKNFCSQ